MDRNLVLVTGMSGAGKTSVMNALEDLGYNCIDSFPKELLGSLESLLENEDPRFDRLALSASAQDYLDFMNFFDNLRRPMKIIFVDAQDDELLLRYRFTRRQHPLIVKGEASTLEEAIELERDYFDHLQANMQDTLHIDTSRMTGQALTNAIKHYFKSDETSDFAITFQSFGFKNGMPMDADEIIDVRFLPNPFYEPELRHKTGNDKEVYDYVMTRQATQDFIVRLKNYLDFVFESYKDQQKSHMIVSIGCTGGQHRSVSICNWLYNTYKEQYNCFCSHRDTGNEA